MHSEMRMGKGEGRMYSISQSAKNVRETGFIVYLYG